MKLVYLTPTLSSPAGMERVLYNKVCHLSQNTEIEISIITSDQGGAPLFFSFPDCVKIVDLGINYSDLYNLPPVKRIVAIGKKKKQHRKLLEDYLERFPQDIVIALYPSEVTFLHKLNDRSKKIIEFHSNRWFRMNQGYKGIHKLIAKFRTRKDFTVARKADRFVVLTNDGAKQWGNLKNIVVIPNALSEMTSELNYSANSRRVIAVGRLIFEKGFDRLLEAWSLLPEDLRKEWHLDIFGQGALKDSLEEMLRCLKIQDSACLNPPTSRIFDEYAKSSFLVMSSRSEGFGMVMIEAMACGVPVVSYNFKCGPEDFIDNNENGLLVPEGDVPALAQAMEKIMRDEKLRLYMSVKAREHSLAYSESEVMPKWNSLFLSLIGNK